MNDRPKGIIERFNKRLTRPLAVSLSDSAWITPNGITWASAAIAGILAPVAIVYNYNFIAAILVLLGALLDSLDGDLARERGTASREGAILDAVLDRYIDFLIVSALIWQSLDCLLPGLAALLGGQMVPYIRARTEAAGKTSVATFGSRDIRNLVLIIGIALQFYCALLIVLAVLSNLSAFHRFFFAVKLSETKI